MACKEITKRDTAVTVLKWPAQFLNEPLSQIMGGFDASRHRYEILF